jgi:hypothetical protein
MHKIQGGRILPLPSAAGAHGEIRHQQRQNLLREDRGSFDMRQGDSRAESVLSTVKSAMLLSDKLGEFRGAEQRRGNLRMRRCQFKEERSCWC